MTDFRQTSDFGPRPEFEHQDLDFGLQTLNFTPVLNYVETSAI